jgi:hypothetical protein
MCMNHFIHCAEKMAETALNLTLGGILSGIGYICLSIEEYSLNNEKILELQREIQMIVVPFIQNCPPQAGIYGRLQKLAVLLQQIKSWITNVGQMSKFKHFVFAISHTKQISKFYLDIKEIKMDLGFEMRVGNFQAQAKLNQQMDELLDSLKHTDDYAKIKLLFDTQRDLCNAKLDAHKEFIGEINGKFSLLIQEQDQEIEKFKYELQQLNTRMADVENQLKERVCEKLTPLVIENQKVQLEIQKVQLDIIRSNNYKTELELVSNGQLLIISKDLLVSAHTADVHRQKIALENQKVQLELSQKNPTCVFGCTPENFSHYQKKLSKLCESIPLAKREQYEDFIQYIERGNFEISHIVTLMEYEIVEQKRKADEKQSEMRAKELDLQQAREHYNQVFAGYRQHLVCCVGEENSHGATAKYREESWYPEHCRLWHIQSQALSRLQQLEREIESSKELLPTE